MLLQEQQLVVLRTGGKINQEQVCYTKDKVLNAIHSIDKWYSDSEELEPINVNASGFEKKYCIAHRTPKRKNDLYSILSSLEKIILGMKKSKKAKNDQKFLMAIIIKGALLADKA